MFNVQCSMFAAFAPLAVTAEKLRQNHIDLTAYIHEICDRIEKIDPEIQALLPEADRRGRLLQEAEALACRFPSPADRPPLYGVLVGVKDIFRVNGFPTQAGSQLPVEEFSGQEAACVTLLKQAGALILGKTVTTEFAYFEPGSTRNPHNVAHTPGGSSSGSAAAVASGMCPLALGTQTIGSVIRPAAFCGIMGFKPSYGRVPTDGLIFFSRSADHVGFFTQDVEGLHLAASILCADWNQNIITQFHPKRLPVLGVPDGPYLQQASEEGIVTFEQQLARLEKQGCAIKRVAAFDDIQAINHRHRQLTSAEAAREHVAWFATYQHVYRPKTEEVILAGQQISDAVVTTSRERQLQLRAHLAQLQQEHKIDLWISPSAPGDAPEGHDSTGDPIMNLPWTHAGVPAITIPAGMSTRGLPLGLQLTGTFMQDELVLAWTTIIQQLLAHH